MKQPSFNSQRIFTLTLLFSFLFTINLFSQDDPCLDPDEFTTDCGTVFDLCIDYRELDDDGTIDIRVTNNDDIGIFNTCDISLPEDVNLLAKHGNVEMLNDNGDCFMRYTLTDFDYVGLDSFDYLLNHVDICNIPEGYCVGGKIWTMDCAYYGPDGATVEVTVKEGNSKRVFATVTNLESGKNFFVNGSFSGPDALKTNQTEWEFKFYADGNTSEDPFNEAAVHTSCSADIFGVNFGIFRPISGCVASKNDKSDCQIVGNERPIEVFSRNATEVTSIVADTTRVFVLIIEGGLLPIDFGYITGQAKGSDNLIQWNIQSVIDEDRMYLQSSSDGIRFNDLATFSNLEEGDFAVLDEDVSSRVTYYRFRIVSVNGSETISRSISVSNSQFKTEDVEVFPNPVIDEINFKADMKITKINIMDLNGRTVYSGINDSSQLSLEKSAINLDKGMFMVILQLENDRVVSKKLTIL